jgi:hypothetical protein
MDDAAPPKKKGTSWWKILLAVLGVGALLFAIGIGALIWWFSANKDRLVAIGKESSEQATAFAATHDQNECVDEGLRKTEACDGIMCEAGAKIFVEHCLPRATPSPHFCDGVPSAGEIMPTVRWIQSECEKRAHVQDPQKCSRLLQAVPPACQQQR